MRGSVDNFVSQITEDYWAETDNPPRAWAVQPGDALSVDLSALDPVGRQLAIWGLDAWTAVTGIRFVERANAQITFTDTEAGAYARTWFRTDGVIEKARVNIHTSWLDPVAELGSSAAETYLHEIGHVLGLAHAGPYDGVLDPDTRIWNNDTTLMTVMSYFGPTYDPLSPVGRAYAVTPMLADVAAVRALYGSGSVAAGNTVWGALGAADGPLGLAFDTAAGAGATPLDRPGFLFTIVDDGGIDLIDAHGLGTVSIDLRPGALSTFEGGAGGFYISEDSWIEDATGGGGADWLAGNDGANILRGGAGGDVLAGRSGDDRLHGEAQDDRLYGGGGRDVLDGGWGRDLLAGGTGNDLLTGGAGGDRLLGNAHGDRLYGGAADDFLDGGWGRDFLAGGTENDVLAGGQSDDRLYGNGGADKLYGGHGNDRLDGGWDADVLAGGDGDDVLAGNRGDDRLDGGAGDDVIWGGAGADLFVFHQVTAGEVDRVCDFEDGIDHIRLTGAADFGTLSVTATAQGVEVGHFGHTLELAGLDIGLIDADDFIFG